MRLMPFTIEDLDLSQGAMMMNYDDDTNKPSEY